MSLKKCKKDSVFCEPNLIIFFGSALNGIFYINEVANRDFYGIDKDIWSELVEESMEEYSRLEGTIDDVSTFDRIIKVRQISTI